MRWFFLVAIAALSASCAQYGQVRRHPGHPTGTCAGACAHYVDCKAISHDDQTYESCVVECRDIYEDPQMLATYERLACEDAIAFIEGDSGRGPGEPRTSSSPALAGSRR